MRSLLALITGLVVFISSVGISGNIPSAPTSPSSQPTPAQNASVSRNWSGYVAQNGTYTGVQGTWVVPQVSTQNVYAGDATWVGVGGVASEDLIQAGTETFTGSNGQVMYRAFYETLPDASIPLTIDVKAGDTISASVSQNKDKSWNIQVINDSNRQKAQVTVSYDSSLSSAEWIEEAPSTTRRVIPLDNFGTIQFTNAKTIQDGKFIPLAQANAQAIAMGSPVVGTLATASIIGQDESSFSVNRVNEDQQIQQQPSSDVFSIRRLHIQGFGRGYFRFN